MTALSVTAIAAVVAVGLLTWLPSGTEQPVSVDRPASVELTTKPLAPPQAWKLTFNSSFTGNKLNTSTWGICYPWSPNGCTNFGKNNNEKEWYQTSQDQVKNGVLSLVAERKPTAGRNQKGAPMEYACRSGMITTYPSFRFEYGYVQIIARIPYGTGLWPAFWLAAANLTWPPEIDILEHWGTAQEAKVYLHPATGPYHGGPVKGQNLSKGWHTFTLYWTHSRITWYFDGQQKMTATTGIPQQAMYLIANLAVYDARPGGCSGTVLIKSVKVWQPKLTKTATTGDLVVRDGRPAAVR